MSTTGNITTLGLTNVAITQSGRAARAGRTAAACVASAQVWNDRFAKVYQQKVIPKGALKADLTAELIKKGQNRNSVRAWVFAGLRLADSHGERIERVIREYMNDRERNTPPTMSGLTSAVIQWEEKEFTTLAEMEEQISSNRSKEAKSDDEKIVTNMVKMLTTVGNHKHERALRDVFTIAEARIIILNKDASDAAKREAQAEITAVMRSYLSEADIEAAEQAAQAAAETEREAAEAEAARLEAVAARRLRLVQEAESLREVEARLPAQAA